MFHVPLIESVEPEGVFMVRNYPDQLTTLIDEEISLFHRVLTTPKKPKEITTSPPKPIPQKKERKRIPAKKIPAYSTKKSQ